MRVPQQNGDAVSIEAELAGRLRLAVGRLSKRLNQQAKGELTLSQWSALATTARNGPLRLGELACIEHVSAPVLTKVVADLEAAGLVDRRADPCDARAHLLAVTAAGQQRLTQLRATYAGLVTDLLTGLADDQRDALAQAVPVLEELADRLTDQPGSQQQGRPTSQPGRNNQTGDDTSSK